MEEKEIDSEDLGHLIGAKATKLGLQFCRHATPQNHQNINVSLCLNERRC